MGATRISAGGSEIRPVEVSFEAKLTEDHLFLVGLIGDPLLTFRDCGFDADEKMMNMLQTVAANIRQRATIVFANLEQCDNACQACDPCL